MKEITSVSLAVRESLKGALAKSVVRAGFDGPPRARHELAHRMEIVNRQKPQRQDFAGHEEMPQVRAREAAAARGAAAIRIDRKRVFAIAGLFDDDATEASQRLAVACVSRREHAIEHVDARRDRVEEIAHRTDAHQVTRSFGIDEVRHFFETRVHLLDRFADGKSAEREPVEARIERGQFLGVRFSQIRKHAPCTIPKSA